LYADAQHDECKQLDRRRASLTCASIWLNAIQADAAAYEFAETARAASSL
jgi:hypothetical protein